MKMKNAATFSLSDLQRAQRTDLVTLALLKLVQSPGLETLQGRPWEAKEIRELEVQIDADVRKIVTEYYNQWKNQLYLNSQGILCFRRKPPRSQRFMTMTPSFCRSSHLARSKQCGAPLGQSQSLRTRKKRRSHHDLNSEEDSTDETQSEDPDSDFDSVLGDNQTDPADDLDVTCADFTVRPVPGYQEVKGDIFRVQQQKKKGFAYALGPCISTDAAMSAEIAPKLCSHFSHLRVRVQQEERKRGTLLAISLPEEQCWV